jgi:hypothetical protein
VTVLLAFFLAPALARAVTITALPLQQTPLAVNSQGEVLFEGLGIESASVWWDGQLTYAKAPSSNSTARFTIPDSGSDGGYSETNLNNSGVVVGRVVSGSGSLPGYWDSESSSTFTPMSASDAMVDGTAATAGSFNAVDDAGEAVGFMSNSSGGEQFSVPAQSGRPTGAPQVIPSSVDGTTIDGIEAISAGYELTLNTDELAILIDRQAQTATETNLLTFGTVFADNGTLAGELYDSSTHSDAGDYVRAPNGAETELATSDPANTGVTAVNDSGDVIGTIDGVATLWEGPGDPVPLSSLLPADSGWSNLVPSAIADNGDIAGSGDYNGSLQQAFLIGTGGPSLSVGAASAVEPNGGDATLSVPVTLSTPQTSAVTVSYATSDGTAKAGRDYDATAGTLTIPAGATTASIPVTIHDVGPEGQQAFTVTLSDPSAGIQLGTSSATATILGRGPLTVTVEWEKNGQPIILHRSGQPDLSDTVQLADDDKGEVTQSVEAAVMITNDSDVTQDNVSVNGVPAVSFANAAQTSGNLPMVTAGPGVSEGSSTTLGDLAPGDSTEVDYTLSVSSNGAFDFSPQILSSDATMQDTEVSNGSGTITALPTALLWFSLEKTSSSTVRAGTPVALTGTLTNRSNTQTLDVDPLEPVTVDGNAGGGRLVALGKTVTLADGVQLPFFGKLQPGQSVTLDGQVTTSYIPGTRATVTYDPQGYIVNSDDSETAVMASQIGMSAGSSPIYISIDTSDPLLPTPTLDSTVDSFTDGAVQGAGQWALGNLRGALGFLQHPIDGTESAISGVAKMVVHAPQDLADAGYILGEAELYGQMYTDLSDAQRGDLENQIVSDFDASDLKADNKALADQAQAGLQDFELAAYDGDYDKLANLAGNGLSTGAEGVADAVFADIFFQKLALGMNSAAASGKAFVKGQLADDMILADKIREAKLASTVVKTVDGIRAGQNLLLNAASALKNAWGLLPDQITALQAFCKENNIIIAVRSRSARAAELIRRGLAVGKNEALKLKGVNEIDVNYLGYAKPDLNKLVLAEPLPLSEIYPKLRGLSPYERSVVLERYDVRVAEWDSPKVRGEMDHAAKQGKIDWGFNGSDNGAAGADRQDYRRFGMHQIGDEKLPNGQKRVYKEVLVGNEPAMGGQLVSVTQDVDVAAILSSNGDILSAAMRTKIYEYLSDVLGIEHPETASWIQKGELASNDKILFQAKLKELSRIVQGGGEALAVFGPDGTATAGFFNPALTIYNSATKAGRIIFDGGYNSPYATTVNTVRVNLRKFF